MQFLIALSYFNLQMIFDKTALLLSSLVISTLHFIISLFQSLLPRIGHVLGTSILICHRDLPGKMLESLLAIHSNSGAALCLVLVHGLVDACGLVEIVISDQPR